MQERIESILNQTYQDFELIILDDASTDESREIIEQYSNHHKFSAVICNTVNSGSTFVQWEKGIAIAKGKYIWIAESDDYCNTSLLKEAVDTLAHENSALHFCQSRLVDEHNNVIEDTLTWPKAITSVNWEEAFTMSGKEFIQKALRYRNVIPNASAVVFRKTNFDFSGLREYKSTGDWLFWIRLLLKGDISYSPNVLNSFRNHATTTRSVSGHHKLLLRYFEEVAVRYRLLADYHLGDKNESQRFLNATIDVCKITDMWFFLNFCIKFGLPKRFGLKLIKKKLLG